MSIKLKFVTLIEEARKEFQDPKWRGQDLNFHTFLQMQTGFDENTVTDLIDVANAEKLKLFKIDNHEILDDIIDSSFDWDKFAEALSNEHGSSHVIDEGSYNNPYDYWLMDVTVKDMVDFIKNYKNEMTT